MTVTLVAKHDVSKNDDNDNETCCANKVSELNFSYCASLNESWAYCSIRKEITCETGTK